MPSSPTPPPKIQYIPLDCLYGFCLAADILMMVPTENILKHIETNTYLKFPGIISPLRMANMVAHEVCKIWGE